MALGQQVVSMVFMVAGVLLLLIAGIGILRMPDLFLRMSAVSKASSLGSACMLVAVAASTDEFGTGVRAIAGAVFLLLTTPVAAHMIGRAAYLTGVPLWRGTRWNELRGRYDPETGVLHSPDELRGADCNERGGSTA